VFLVFGCINPAIIMVSECPNLSPTAAISSSSMSRATTQSHGAADTLTAHNNNTLDVLVRYDEWDAARQEMAEHALMLKYNVTHGRIERRIWKPEQRGWQQTQLAVHQLATEPLCTTQRHSRFYFMEDEMREALADRRAATEARKSLSIKSGHDSTRAQSLEDEDAFDHHRKMRRICRFEYAYLIMFLVYLAALFVIHLVALLFFMMSVKTRATSDDDEVDGDIATSK
jgi:hypothetical protein